jgi:hypothetical protein
MNQIDGWSMGFRGWESRGRLGDFGTFQEERDYYGRCYISEFLGLNMKG